MRWLRQVRVDFRGHRVTLPPSHSVRSISWRKPGILCGSQGAARPWGETMQSRLRKYLPGMLGLLLFGGCLAPVREEADLAVCDKAAHAIDLQPLTQADESSRMPPAQAKDS